MRVVKSENNQPYRESPGWMHHTRTSGSDDTYIYIYQEILPFPVHRPVNCLTVKNVTRSVLVTVNPCIYHIAAS
jgi:hypothetical protein